MTKRLVVFNHKGGVSKTTSAYNMGWMMSRDYRVLLVDADPQCNLTGLLLGDSFEEYYSEPQTREHNIKDGVSSAFSGKPVPIRAVNCVTTPRAKTLFLLAGHANLSEYDAALTFAQTSNNALATLQNLPGAFAQLLTLTEKAYNIDYTIIDLNPGLSSINQNLFLISNAFIIPTNPDPFSLMALDTLRSILPRWVAWKDSVTHLFEDSAYPLPAGIPKFLGSLVQRFNIRNGRAARPYRDNISEINNNIRDKLIPALRQAGMALTPDQYGDELIERDYCIGQIADFQGLLPKSFEAGVPIFELKSSEIKEGGPILAGLIEKRDLFEAQFAHIASDVVDGLDYA